MTLREHPDLLNAVGLLGGWAIVSATYLLGRWRLKQPRVGSFPDRPKDAKALRLAVRRIQNETYLKSMDSYDRLLLWATAGAFIVSWGAVQFLASRQETFEPLGSGYLLGGWLLMLVAAFFVVFNPYSASERSTVAISRRHGPRDARN